jgi:starch phosphorylase
MPTWVAPEIAELLRRYVGPDWWDLDGKDGRWQAVFEIPAAELWAVHVELKKKLLAVARARSIEAEGMDEHSLTFGFARRFAPYKRANLVLQDRARLSKLLRNSERPVQFLFAGKSHPADQPGKDIVAGVVKLAREEPCIAFLSDYDLALARHLVHGADVWLNNPLRFLEASGTSGMNGIPQRWVEMMRASIRYVATDFAARRMVIDYFETAYAPGARRVEQLRLLPDWGG